MARQTHFCVQPFDYKGKRLTNGQMRTFTKEADALRVGENAAPRHAGLLVYRIEGDAEFDDWGEPKVLASYGEVPEAP